MNGRDVTADAPAGAARALTADGAAVRDQTGLSHAAWLYDGDDAGPVAAMAARAARSGWPLHIVLPRNTMRLVREALPPEPPRAFLADMADLGGNPARLIAAAQSFADEHPGARVSCFWEPAWPARSAAELLEVARHEALCNVAFGDRAMTIVCLYDTRRLPASVIGDAVRTHPLIIASGTQHASPGYLGAGRLPPGCDDALPPAAADALSLRFDTELGPVREFSAAQARAAGLDAGRTSDVVLAVHEIAANALGHSARGGVVRTWWTDDELLYQIEDSGHITDPLAGRRRQPADARGGHGLWLVNLVCDLVERRSSAAGTITRLHMRRSGR